MLCSACINKILTFQEKWGQNLDPNLSCPKASSNQWQCFSLPSRYPQYHTWACPDQFQCICLKWIKIVKKNQFNSFRCHCSPGRVSAGPEGQDTWSAAGTKEHPWYSVFGYYWLFYCANWFLIVFLHFLCLIPPALVLILPKMASPITSVMRPIIRLDSPNVSVVQMSRKSHRRCWFPWCFSIQVAVMTMRMMMSWWWWLWRWWWPGSWYSVQRTWPDHIGLFRR